VNEAEIRIRELVDKHYAESGLDKKNAELRLQIQALEEKQGVLTLESAEERVETYVRRGLTYEQAFDMVVEELEEQDLAAKTKREQAQKEKTEAQLAEMDRRAETKHLFDNEGEQE
jgi:hypothetical protein